MQLLLDAVVQDLHFFPDRGKGGACLVRDEIRGGNGGADLPLQPFIRHQPGEINVKRGGSLRRVADASHRGAAVVEQRPCGPENVCDGKKLDGGEGRAPCPPV